MGKVFIKWNIAIALALAMVLLSGCSTTGVVLTCQLKATAGAPIDDNGGKDDDGGKGDGSPGKQNIQAFDLPVATKEISVSGMISVPEPLQQMRLLLGASYPDSSVFAIDVSGSTVVWPQIGKIVVSMKDSGTSTIIASKRFNYVKVAGEKLIFQSPQQVDLWLENNSESALSSYITYQTVPFTVTPAPGLNVVQVKAFMDGNPMSSSRLTFRGAGCFERGRSKELCRM